MSYSSTPNRNVMSDDYLQQRLGNLSLQNEFAEGMYSIQGSEPYDTQGEMLSGQWDYQTPENRNIDAVVTDLTPEEVRWFYKSDGEKRWLEFSGYDSYRIEMRYREMFFNKTDYGSKYSSYSAFSDSSSDPSSSRGMGSQFGASSIRFPGKQQQATNFSGPSGSQMNFRYSDHQHKIVVRGGLYDVNFDTWKCASIYWPGEECLITRGTWFYEGTWQPLDREQSSTLETKHLSMFQGRKVNEFADNEAKGTPVHTETFPEFIVEWFSPNQVYLYSEKTPSKIVRSFTTRLGFHKSTGYRLFRGYKTDANVDDRPDVEINHLVFVIHGIGQKMDTGRIIRNTSSLRDCVSWLKQKYFMNFPNHRAEFFPVEWRSNLQLDGELVDAITPNTLQSLRQMLNASAMDIMYYTSPLYGSEVQRGLREELNRLYSMFSARNPYFMNKGGKISVIAHSLGCVILYDIIMGLKPGSLVQNSQQGLLFQIQNFFCLGSPLAVFLALRWKDSQIPGKLNTILPPRLCHRLYNVFHPTDPVAYRIEPLLVKEYYRIAPLTIQPYNATCHTPYSEMPLEVQGPDQYPGQQQQQPNNTQQTTTGAREDVSAILPPVSPGRDRTWSIWGMMKNQRRSGENSSYNHDHEGLDYRLDYILRESNLGVSYLSALTSHTAYWTNYDIAYFILTQIFPEFETNPGGIAAAGLTKDPPYLDKYNSYSHPSTAYPDVLNRIGYDDTHPIRPNVVQPLQPQPHDFPPHHDDYLLQDHAFKDYQYGQPGYQQGFQDQFSLPSNAPPSNFDGHPQAMSSYGPGGGPMPGPSNPKPPSNFMGPSNQRHPVPPQQFNQSFQQPMNQQQQMMHQNPQQMMHQNQQQPMQNLPQQGMMRGPQPTNQQQIMHQNQQQMHHQQQQSMQQQHMQQQGMMRGQQQPTQPQKTGFFDTKQNVSSPTKGTKSFFPSFNLSSLTSPVKNLSNSLSNISNQMTNMASKEIIGTGQQQQMQQQQQQQMQQQQNQQSRSSFLGGPPQNKQNYQGAPQGGSYVQYVGPNQQQQFISNTAQSLPSQQQQMQLMNNPNMQTQQQMGMRSMSPYDKQSQPMNIRSSSPVNIQQRPNMMQYGPIETPTGTIKTKMTRIQPKIPGSYETKLGYTSPPESIVSTRSRCVSPLGQSKVVCSGTGAVVGRSSGTMLPGSYNMGLGARSLSSGNLRNTTLITGSYPGTRSNVGFSTLPTTYTAASSPTSSLSRRTMSRPNLSSSGSSFHSSPGNSAIGMSNLGYTSSFGGKSYLSRDYSGPSSR